MTVDELETVVPLTRRRRRLHAPRAWKVWLAVLVLVVVALAAAWTVFFSSLLGLRTVDVSGTHTVPVEQVRAAASVAPGTPLARIDLSAVQARVEAIPAVAAATVTRGWPHTLDISVTERRPIAVVHQDGTWWVMDKESVLFAKASGRTASEPVVQLLGDPGPGTLPQVASVLGSLPPSLLSTTRRVTASSIDSITLVLKSGSLVRWGNASDSAQKASVLQALLTHKAHIYDVTIPSQPATVH